MLTCIACSKQLNTNNDGSKEEDDRVLGTPRSKQTIKSLTSQIKEMAVKASGAYKSCKPCPGSSNRKHRDSDAATPSGGFHYAYKRPISESSTPKILGKQMESRLKRLLSGEATPESISGMAESTVFMEEEDDEVKEWVAQVEPGVLITFVLLPEGENDLKQIRFSREMFDKWEAQKWWKENFDNVTELYNVQQFNQQSVPFPAPPGSKDEHVIDSLRSNVNQFLTLVCQSCTKNSLATSPLNKECLQGKGSTTPKVSGISGTKTETSSVDMFIKARSRI